MYAANFWSVAVNSKAFVCQLIVGLLSCIVCLQWLFRCLLYRLKSWYIGMKSLNWNGFTTVSHKFHPLWLQGTGNTVSSECFHCCKAVLLWHSSCDYVPWRIFSPSMVSIGQGWIHQICLLSQMLCWSYCCYWCHPCISFPFPSSVFHVLHEHLPYSDIS